MQAVTHLAVAGAYAGLALASGGLRLVHLLKVRIDPCNLRPAYTFL